MDEDNSFFVLILIGLIIYLGISYYKTNKKLNEVTKQIGVTDSSNSDLTTKIGYIQSELETRQETITYLNNEILDAKNEAWSDYDSMGDALDNLETSY